MIPRRCIVSQPFTYRFTFAVVNWLDATVRLLTLGWISPNWSLNTAKHLARRSFRSLKGKV